ncbi:DUF4359 domain-containing protein [Candidatus Gracilibacteria bacterium]|jgi:uncharacterized protein YceK|nr:DUF4359 domain-containing protein [Candidatus Gracilibacteria bacterium]NJM87938.1 DUF4359 domain-containing protein [Hydrococcus sp. RU_2_2]NJP21181.1 DUF4359 domain-containing protein [Hydrococcus sp. CRU_1_1]NJQ97129.1 DUF4359 domain-containing protein [Hydrococcus sp. CSU_1_8]
MQGSLVKGGIALAGLAVIMGVTNPRQEAYNDYASQRLMTNAQEEMCKEFNYCRSGEPPSFIKNTLIKPAISASTNQQNLGIFSIYTTELFGFKTKTLGVFGNFLTYSDS